MATALEQTGFRSGQLTLEVTEDAIVDPAASADLRHLSQMGVQLSVDDAGTNWSSFEPFKRHSISTVKIDGSFVSGLEPNQGINRLVVETVIHMAHSLGMSAIVEAVETASQVEIVRSFNADAAQGFFFARPMSGELAASLAGGTEVPQFSRTEIRTILRPTEPVGYGPRCRGVRLPTAMMGRPSRRPSRHLPAPSRASLTPPDPVFWRPPPILGVGENRPVRDVEPAISGVPVGGTANLLYTSGRETRCHQRVATGGGSCGDRPRGGLPAG